MEQKLVQVERGNVILRVPEDDVQRFVGQGYNVIDNAGNVVQASIPKDLGTLQKAYVEQVQEIKKLKAEIENLKAIKRTSGRKKKED